MLVMRHRSRQSQEAEPPLLILDTQPADALLALGSAGAGVAQPSPLAMGVSLAWGCWRGPACPTPPWLDGSGAGYIPANSFFRQELEVPAGKNPSQKSLGLV